MGATATAASDWSAMESSTACLDDRHTTGNFMTCALPAHTTFNRAFSLAASLPSCKARSGRDCYDDALCRFCFSTGDEFWALEAAMGISIPKCKVEKHDLNCPSKHDVDKWYKTGL